MLIITCDLSTWLILWDLKNNNLHYLVEYNTYYDFGTCKILFF